MVASAGCGSRYTRRASRTPASSTARASAAGAAPRSTRPRADCAAIRLAGSSSAGGIPPERRLRRGEFARRVLQASEVVERAAQVVVEPAGAVILLARQRQDQRQAACEGRARRLVAARLAFEHAALVQEVGVARARLRLERVDHLTRLVAVAERAVQVVALRMGAAQLLQRLEQDVVRRTAGGAPRRQRVLQERLGRGALPHLHVGPGHGVQQAGADDRRVAELVTDPGRALVEHLAGGDGAATGLLRPGQLEEPDQEIGHLIGGARVERRPRLGLAGAVALASDRRRAATPAPPPSRPAARWRPTPRRPRRGAAGRSGASGRSTSAAWPGPARRQSPAARRRRTARPSRSADPAPARWPSARRCRDRPPAGGAAAAGSTAGDPRARRRGPRRAAASASAPPPRSAGDRRWWSGRRAARSRADGVRSAARRAARRASRRRCGCRRRCRCAGLLRAHVGRRADDLAAQLRVERRMLVGVVHQPWRCRSRSPSAPAGRRPARRARSTA